MDVRKGASRASARITALFMACLVLCALLPPAAYAAEKTGAGMTEWALRAYNEGWKYKYGGSSAGSVDCSGLIRSYTGAGGGARALLDAAPSSGKISSMPRVHGLGLWCEGHAGVYVGKNDSGENMAVDMRNSKVNVVYSAMNSRNYNPWTRWFKIKGVSYPSTGWVSVNGKKYYYQDGEFVVGVHKVDGKTYDFGRSGALKGEVDPNATTAAQKTTTSAAKKTTTASSDSLKTGMSGDRVTKLQKRLIELGWLNAEATGYYGEQTAKAVREFQKAASLTADGVAGKSTQEAIYSSKAPKKAAATTTKKTTAEKVESLRMGAKGDSVLRVQKRLIELGYLSADSATGYYGETTAKAVQKFQRKVGLPDDGVAGQTTQDKLFAAAAPTAETTTTTKKYESLRMGAEGSEVLRVQKRLIELGWLPSDCATGFYGETTAKAVQQFQRKVGLSDDGVAGQTTVEKLFADSAPRISTTAPKTTTTTKKPDSLRMGSEGDEVLRVQKRLIELGWLSSDCATGFYGETTAKAVQKFQRKADLPDDGVAGADTVQKLFASDAPTQTAAPSTTTTAETTSSEKKEKTTSKTTRRTTTSTTAATEPEYDPYVYTEYEELAFGTQGEQVRYMAKRLAELGYYDHDISDYYGVFLRIAVMNFQLNAGLGVTGTADVEMQERLFAPDAPASAQTLSDEEIYGDSLDMDEDAPENADSVFDGAEAAGEVVLKESAGLDAFSSEADIKGFIGRYGDSGELQTMGVFSFSAPMITVYRDGESYEVSEELDMALENCVLY